MMTCAGRFRGLDSPRKVREIDIRRKNTCITADDSYLVTRHKHLLKLCHHLTIGGSVPTGSPDTSSTSAPVVSPTSSAPVASPTIFDPPVAAPVVSPTTTLAPVAAPTDGEEDDIACIDSPLKFVFKKIPRNCVWASKGNSVKRCAKKGVSAHCPSTCGTCEEKKCSDSGRKFVLENGAKKRCGFFARNTDRCDKFDNAVETCRDSCGYCDYYDGEE